MIMTREQKLADAITSFLAVADGCPRRETGAGGMTIDAQMQRTVVRVPLLAICELEDALYIERTGDEG